MWRQLAKIVITFWVGSLWMTGLTARILFENISDRSLAGDTAGHLFTTVSTIGLISGVLLLVEYYLHRTSVSFKPSYIWIIAAMLLLVVVGQFGIQPVLTQIKADALPGDVMLSAHAGRFATWHGVAVAVYLLECLLGIGLILKAKQ